MQKIYLDTVLISALKREDIVPKELAALQKMRVLHQKSSITCYVSELVKTELSRLPEEHRRVHIEVYELFERSKLFKHKAVMDVIGTGIIPFPREYPLLSKLKQVFDEADAEHIFQAIKNDMFFITVDSGILNNRNSIEMPENFEIFRPTEFISQLSP